MSEKSPVPDDLELRPDVTLDDTLETLARHANQLIFGRDERGAENEPGELTAFRAVVIVGGMIGLGPNGLGALAVGLLHGDGSPYARDVYPRMARRLRLIADELDRAHATGVLPQGEGTQPAKRGQA